MTPAIGLLAALAGGLGATARYALDSRITAHVGGAFPWGTFIINVTGALLLGVVTGAANASLLPEPWSIVLGMGFLGGYTTFSTASVQAAELFARRRARLAVGYAGGMLIAALAAGLLGLGLFSA